MTYHFAHLIFLKHSQVFTRQKIQYYNIRRRFYHSILLLWSLNFLPVTF